jgi:hypothetical protein
VPCGTPGPTLGGRPNRCRSKDWLGEIKRWFTDSEPCVGPPVFPPLSRLRQTDDFVNTGGGG